MLCVCVCVSARARARVCVCQKTNSSDAAGRFCACVLFQKPSFLEIQLYLRKLSSVICWTSLYLMCVRHSWMRSAMVARRNKNKEICLFLVKTVSQTSNLLTGLLKENMDEHTSSPSKTYLEETWSVFL